MIVDFHTHCFPDDIAERAVTSLSMQGNIPARLNGTVNDLKLSMKKSNISYSIIQPIATKPSQTTSINNWAASVQDENIISFGTLHPLFEDWENELVRLKEMNIKGIKFHPEYQQFFVNDKSMIEIYRRAADLGFIILFHAGLDIGFEPPYHCTPKRLKNIIDLAPEAEIVAAHMGGYQYWDDVEKYLVGTSIYLDTAYCFRHIPLLQLMRIIRNHGYERILFATDSPWKDQDEELQFFNSLELEEGIKNAILGLNAQRLLDI